jgi:hypothetical protein
MDTTIKTRPRTGAILERVARLMNSRSNPKRGYFF